MLYYYSQVKRLQNTFHIGFETHYQCHIKMCIRYFISRICPFCSVLIGRITCGAVTTFGRPSAGTNAVTSENWGGEFL
ncbi:UNVERIFIED_CONTAM: hypothetical protein NCL1_50441 [Trichonephila clavipes]